MPSSTTSTTELARFLCTTGPEQFALSNKGEPTCKTSTPFFRLRSSSHSNKKKKKQLLLLHERDQDEPENVFSTTPTAPKAHSPYRFQQQRQQGKHNLYYKHHHKKHIPLPVYVPPSPSPPPHPTTISASSSSSTENNNNKERSNSCSNSSTAKTPKNNNSSSLETTKAHSTNSSTTLIPMFPQPPSHTALRTPASSESLPSTKFSPGKSEEKCPHCCRRFKSVKKGLRRISCPPAIHYTPSKTTNTLSTKALTDDKMNHNVSKQEGGLTSQEAKTLLQMIEKLQHQLAQEQTSRQALENALRNTKG